jgi:hypothetical protein
MAGLVGMFTPEAILKLKEVAGTLLAKPETGKDAVPQRTTSAAGQTDETRQP